MYKEKVLPLSLQHKFNASATLTSLKLQIVPFQEDLLIKYGQVKHTHTSCMLFFLNTKSNIDDVRILVYND